MMIHLIPAALSVLIAAAPMTAPRLVFLGDSLTAGYMLNRQSAYPALLQKRIEAAGLPWTVLNAGVSGDTTAGALRRADALLKEPIGLLVIWIGGNNGLPGQDTAAMKQNVDRILTAAKSKSVPTMLVDMQVPPNMGQAYSDRFHAVFAELAKQHDIPLIPFALDGIAGEETMNLSDGIHPNAKGHERIADHLWRHLEPRLRDLSKR